VRELARVMSLGTLCNVPSSAVPIHALGAPSLKTLVISIEHSISISRLCVFQMHHLRKFGQRTLSITVSSMPPWMPVLPIRVPEHMAHGMCRLGRSFRVLQDGVTIAGVAVVPDLAACQTTE
jgi:hypothetical protein